MIPMMADRAHSESHLETAGCRADVVRRGHSLPHTANMNISLYDGMESNKEEKVNSDCENKTKKGYLG